MFTRGMLKCVAWMSSTTVTGWGRDMELNEEFTKKLLEEMADDEKSKVTSASGQYTPKIFPAREIPPFAEGENRDWEYSVVVWDKDPQVYQILLTNQSAYKVYLSNPPHPDSEEMQDIYSWKVEVRVGTIKETDLDKLSYGLREAIDVSFADICTHWFFNGR